jgi:poly(beta-D-mannuronate) C5 epimerase
MHDMMTNRGRAPRATRAGRWLATAVALLLSGPLFAQAVPNQDSLDLQARLSTLDQLAADPAYDWSSVLVLLDTAGLGDRVHPILTGEGLLQDGRPVSARAAVISQMNLRLALTPLTQAFGADGNATVLVAQTDPSGSAIVISDGDVNGQVLRDHLGLAEGPLRLTRPLIVMQGASLLLGPEDNVELSRADGAFIINFGHLDIDGASIIGTTDPNNAARSFRPFVATVGAGTVDLRDALLRDLGFGSTVKFAGFSILRSILQSPERPSRIDGSRFERLGSVAIAGDSGILLRGNRFVDMTGASLSIQRTADARVLTNLFTGAMRTNAIRLEGGSQNALVAGNIVLGGDRAGIVVREDVHDATLAGNIVWNRDGGGIALTDADCSVVHDNLIIANDQKGIEVRSSDAVQLHRNTIFSNHSAGIWISDQRDPDQVLLTDNIVAYNGAGLAGANSAQILMAGNDFSRQYQQFLSGDLALLTPTVARDMRGTEPFVLASGATFDPAVSLVACDG